MTVHPAAPNRGTGRPSRSVLPAKSTPGLFCNLARTLTALLSVLWTAADSQADQTPESKRPNVIVIMTDDQGYGDFGATGNRLIETPAIDDLAAHSASMATFYVSPVCSPTRACLMTGRYNFRTRCIDTWLGRSMMDPAEVTVAEYLSQAGYATGIFGKWHLGDNYPLRPMDQGFSEVLIHRGGGLAQPSEPLENAQRYTNPILYRNGVATKTEGYCTDVYFEAARDFIRKQTAASQPFFVYLPTNAPHGPFHDVPQDLYEHYLKKDLSSLAVGQLNPARRKAEYDKLARIAAMITNVDANVGRLVAELRELDQLDNTLIMVLVDNGPNSRRFVGPFRGSKSQVYEGGIRSPLWLHWPARLKPGTVRREPVAHIDLLPTILDACQVTSTVRNDLDGRSFLPLLTRSDARWPERSLVIQAHRGDRPQKYHNFMIRRGRWKLLHASGFGQEVFRGEFRFELYDVEADPGEQRNLLGEHADVASQLQTEYDKWFRSVSTTRPDNYAPPRIIIGSSHENPSVLTRQDWRGATWAADAQGHWLIHVDRAGQYDVRVVFHPARPKSAAGRARLTVQGKTASQLVGAGATSCEFRSVQLDAGDCRIAVELTTNVEPQPVDGFVYQLIVSRRSD